MHEPVQWPEGKTFAFTVFDDPDFQRLDAGREVYALLADLGFRTTKGIWPIGGDEPGSSAGGSCDDAGYRDWCMALVEQGFEMGFHNATHETSERERTRRGLDRYVELFGHDPATMSNHYNCDEDVYWGEHRVSGLRRHLYNALTRGQNHDKFFGHVPGHRLYWGDLCKERVKYVRNFVYARINTLAACPYMPYHDPERPLVNYWYASSEGANVRKFTKTISEANQDQLAEEGGACIMYTHFGYGYLENGRLDPDFRRLMTRLSKMNGWFVPASTLLDFLLKRRGTAPLTDAQRAELERRWLWDKVQSGTS